MPVELNEKLLIEAAGWQTLKQAKGLCAAGRVSAFHYAPPLLTGSVKEGETEFRAGLKIISKSNVENLCTCIQSRRYGTICAHSIAVGLAAAGLGLPKVSPVESGPAPLKTGPRFCSEGEGVLVRLHLILPPNFLNAWGRGQIMVGAEIERSGQRSLLNTLDAKGEFRAGPEDLPVLEKLRKLGSGKLPGMAILPKTEFLDVLALLSGHPRVTFGKITPVIIKAEPVIPGLHVEVTAEGGSRLNGVLGTKGELLIGGAAWLFDERTFTPVAPGLPAPYFSLLQGALQLSPEESARFLGQELPKLQPFFEITGDLSNAPETVPADPYFELYLEGSLNHLTARLQAVYPRSRVTIGIKDGAGDFTIPDPADPRRLLTRNHPRERAAERAMQEAGFTSPGREQLFTLSGEKKTIEFMAQHLNMFEQRWNVTFGERFEHVSQSMERLNPKLEIRSSGTNWFDLNFQLSADSGQQFSSADLQRLLQSGQNHVRLKNGKIALFDPGLVDDFQSVLAECNPVQAQPGTLRVDRAQAGFLDSALADGRIMTNAPPEWSGWASSQRSQENLTPIPLGAMEEVLRPYQKQGVYWMHFLAANHFGGLLADEMGLGKTVQALTFLATRTGGEPALIVCPSSLIQNWKREAARFHPNLRCLVLEGPRRAELFRVIPDADLVITSYPLLRRDAGRYREIDFGAIVLDEAQHLKNPDTQNAQAAMSLRARAKFVLTGTPIENSVRDIWTLMSFLMPGYLGTRTDFKERYEIPIMREQSAVHQKRLNDRLRPFMLRRTKAEYLKELPPKIEQVTYCDLTPQQTTVYAELLRHTRKEIDSALSARQEGQARMLMLTALLRLRQACCDLRLLALPDVKEAQASAKLDMLDELLAEIIDGGHRVLIFSQFASMLHLIRDRLKASEIRYSYLDGQTKDRGGEVDRFQNDEGIPVFLISLKAGGVGLNLPGADTVIHFDPWWNPAVEAQATDRAHRMGQKKVVTAYKLITRGTVEEKILALQEKKRAVIAATVESDEPLMSSLSMDEIRTLLE